MYIILQKTAQDAANFTARLVADALRDNPKSVLGLATGRTMEPVYERLIELHKKEKLDFSKCTTFNLDEYVGVSPKDSISYRATMQRLLFDHVNVRRAATHVPNGMAKDVVKAGADYEEAIAKAGGVDLQLLGIGMTGHIGFNEPLSSFSSLTREQVLAPETFKANAGLCGGSVPTRAITMGVATILASRRAVMLVTGKKKAKLMAQVIEGPVTGMLSASALHFHEDCVVVLDAEAASCLKHKKYYSFVFENSSEWAKYR
jgi:glucosamine-6-phosphate deaminase